MKIFISILGFLNGAYMLADGIFVMLKGKYIGPAKPGPWANLFDAAGINVFKLGPIFIVFGIVWLTWLYSVWSRYDWSATFGIIISMLTLWYLPVGTIFSLIILGVLLFFKKKLM